MEIIERNIVGVNVVVVFVFINFDIVIIGELGGEVGNGIVFC